MPPATGHIELPVFRLPITATTIAPIPPLLQPTQPQPLNLIPPQRHLPHHLLHLLIQLIQHGGEFRWHVLPRLELAQFFDHSIEAVREMHQTVVL